MDRYTKLVLTVIAVCLIAIAIKLWEPTPAYSGFIGDTVRKFLPKPITQGDIINLRKLKGAARRNERNRIIRDMPLVRVYTIDATVNVSGSVDVTGYVDVTGSVSIDNTVDVNVENVYPIDVNVKNVW